MLRLAPLQWQPPTDLADALELLQRSGSRAVAGGSDLVPNLKLASTRAEVLIPIKQLAELQGVVVSATSIRLGAACGLAELASDPDVQELLPALAQALGRVASPQIRNMGTLGGNLCLDTRCRYINQSELWREALGGCLKSHGSECHVVPGGQGCVAALSADSAPVLIAYGAIAHIARAADPVPESPAGSSRAVAWRSLPVADLYTTDGLAHVDLRPGELLTHVEVPIPALHSRVVYRKWAVRQSIDFPLVSAALRLDCTADGLLAGGLLAIGALGPRPRVLKLSNWAGAAVNEELAQQLGDLAFDRCRPLPNIPYDSEYRRERLRVEVRRAVRQWFLGPT